MSRPAWPRIRHDKNEKPGRGAVVRAPLHPYVFAAALLTLVSTAIFAAAPVHVVKTDLTPLIRAAAQSPVQFAVLVPHSASTTGAGMWSVARGRATWNYTVR